VHSNNLIAQNIIRNPLQGFPLLIGCSKKSFLGTVLKNRTGRDTQPHERLFATAAAVTCAASQNCLLVRVHDPEEIMDVLSVTEALSLV
jgi:dihydroneopterin aldolase / 2-amino-4-hydroxy-6-hydroxymethyldihydropteridine diphosphokinase / dihydropteroate synthase